MTDGRESIRQAFERTDAIEAREDGYTVTTTVFDSRVTVTDGEVPVYVVTMEVPTLATATEDDIGPAVAEGWLETLERRLAEASKATRRRIDLDRFDLDSDGESVRIEYKFTHENTDVGVDTAKTLVEYVEGTYVESTIPGYEYTDPVSTLLAAASQSGEGGTPL